MMTFGEAIDMLRGGGRVRRAAWEAGLWLELQCEKILIVAQPPNKQRQAVHRTEWLPTQASILADDWQRTP